MALVTAAALPWLVWRLAGTQAIRWLGRFARPRPKTESAELARLSQAKARTPSMGGLVLLPALGLGYASMADWQEPQCMGPLLVLGGFGLIGFVDDLLKARGRGGLSARMKLLAQLAAAAALLSWSEGSTAATLWGVLVLVASSNAVNLADGLDGLAAGLALPAALAFGLLGVMAGGNHASNVALAAAATCGSLLGFLRYNRHPARLFMGDTGSLPLGALLGWISLALGHELLWMLIGAVFVAEALSVLVQIGYFKWCGRRVFRCAPLHHHFQFEGWPERKIVGRFCAAGAASALLALLIALLGQFAWQPPTGLLAADRIAQSTDRLP